jgi:parallel beta-helix repeat protein
MKKKYLWTFSTLAMILLLVSVSFTTTSIILQENNNQIDIVYVDDDYNETTPGWGYDHFNKIKDGINTVSTNGTIYVSNGKYYERFSIEKSLKLIGEDKNSTIIDGQNLGTIIKIRADWVTITGFKIRNSRNNDWFRFGIEISSQDPEHLQNNAIYDNIVTNHNTGIISWWGSGNTISGNIVKSNKFNGIYLDEGTNNNISFNHIEDNNIGICFIIGTKNNLITRNNFIDNAHAIHLFYAPSNKIIKNNFINSEPTFTHPNILFFNKWNGNYWNRPTLVPKPILGKIEKFQLHYLSFRWYNIDWNPAKEPNENSFPGWDKI